MDTGVELYTGKSIGEHLDDYVREQHGINSLNIYSFILNKNMILDYLFFRLYKAYKKYKHEGDPFERSKGCLLVILQIVIIPLSLNISVLYGEPNRLTNVIPYAIINALSYWQIHKRYNKQYVKSILGRYESTNKKDIPMFFIWIIVALSAALGLIFAVLFDYYVMRPLGFVGIFK